MIAVIKSLLKSGQKQLAEKYSAPPQEVQIVVCFRGTVQEPEVIYWSYVSFEPKEQITFKQAIGREGKLSFLADGQQELCRNFLTQKMQTYVVVDGVKMEELFFIIRNENDEIKAMVMNSDKCIEDVTLNELFQ